MAVKHHLGPIYTIGLESFLLTSIICSTKKKVNDPLEINETKGKLKVIVKKMKRITQGSCGMMQDGA